MSYTVPDSMIDTSQQDVVKFTGAAGLQLVNSLIQKPSITLVEISLGGAPVNLSDIEVDSNCNVSIKSPSFYAAVTGAINTAASHAGPKPMFNWNCHCQ